MVIDLLGQLRPGDTTCALQHGRNVVVHDEWADTQNRCNGFVVQHL